MRRTSLVVALAALAAAAVIFGATGCSAASPTKPANSSTVSGSQVVVTEKEASTTVLATVGKPLLVQLQANPSTGFTWKASAVPTFTAQVGEPVFVSQAPSGTVGAGGTQNFTFTVKAAGEGPLAFVYARPFEKGVAPAKTFVVNLSAQ